MLWVSVGLNCYRYALWGLFFFGCCLSRQAESTVLIGCIASSLEKKTQQEQEPTGQKSALSRNLILTNFFSAAAGRTTALRPALTGAP